MQERLYSKDLTREELFCIYELWHLSRVYYIKDNRYDRLIYVLNWFLHTYPIYDNNRTSIFKIIDEEIIKY